MVMQTTGVNYYTPGWNNGTYIPPAPNPMGGYTAPQYVPQPTIPQPTQVSAPSASPVQLAIQLDGETLPETAMYEEITTPGVGQSVAAATLVRTGAGCCGRIGVVNTGTTTISVLANTSLFVKRIA